jgi:hypothetical protein
LLFEIVRRDWKNTVLIVTVGVINGTGWALCQNWLWARDLWPNAVFNFGRCWESSGGIAFGLGLGVAYFLVNRPMSAAERALVATRRAVSGPNFEWLLIYAGLDTERKNRAVCERQRRASRLLFCVSFRHGFLKRFPSLSGSG